MFPTGLPSPNPPPPAQEPKPAASDVHNDSSLTSSKKRKINSSEKEDIDSISSSPKAICNSSSTTSCSSSSQQQQHIQKKLRFEDPLDLIGLDVKMAEESCNPAESCSKARNVFLAGGVGHHANGLTKSVGSATFSNSKPGAAKKLVIKNFKGRRRIAGPPRLLWKQAVFVAGCLKLNKLWPNAPVLSRNDAKYSHN